MPKVIIHTTNVFKFSVKTATIINVASVLELCMIKYDFRKMTISALPKMGYHLHLKPYKNFQFFL